MTLMRDEIDQVPAIVEGIVAPGRADEFAAAAAAIRAADPRWVTFVARGTSDHAAIYGRFLVEVGLGLPVGLASPSVTTVYEAPLAWAGGLAIAVSQSGQSPDIVAVLEAAQRGGAITLAITNDAGSPLAAAAAHHLDCAAGPERSVAATKTYIAELAVLAALTAALTPGSALAAALPALPDALERALTAGAAWLEGPADALVGAVAGARRAIVASRGFNLATALETALKLKETGGIFAEGYSTADLEHGPIALAEPGVPALVIRPDGPIGGSIDAATRRLASAGVPSWQIGGSSMAGVPQALVIDPTGRLPEALTPLAYVLPGQLLAEAVARRVGRNPDAPAGLTKVTLTR